MEYYFLQNIENVIKNFDQDYGQIADASLLVKKSKFYSYLFSIDDEKTAQDYINLIRENNKNSRHVVYVYSYLINGQKIVRYDEDGEPQGTATKALVEYIEKEMITSTCIIIVRYFGGILLGSGPLTRAYFNVSKFAIDMCRKVKLYFYQDYIINVNYNRYKDFNSLIKEYVDAELIKIKSTNFDSYIVIHMLIEKNRYNEIHKKIEGGKFYE